MNPNSSKALAACVLMVFGTVTTGSTAVYADTVFLKRGGSLEGDVIEGESTVEIKLDGGSTTFNKTEIDRIEKDPDPNANKGFSGFLNRLKDGASTAAKKTKTQASKTLKNVKKQTAGWTKPVGRSQGAVAKEKMVNKTFKDMEAAQKKLHARDKAIAQQKRALKKDGFNIH